MWPEVRFRSSESEPSLQSKDFESKVFDVKAKTLADRHVWST